MLIKFPAQLSLTLALVFVCLVSATAQQTKVVNYQGSLTDGAAAANGVYQMEFRLYETETNGKPIQIISDDAVQVKNGVFKVDLNFAANAFDRAAQRYLEIAVRKPSEANFTTLPARQMINNSPYALKTLSATLDGNELPAGKTAPDGLIGNRVVLTGIPAGAITYTTGQFIAGRNVTINKTYPETLLRVTYMETFSANAMYGIGAGNGQVFITCDGNPPYNNPGKISAIVFPIANTVFLYGQANIVGYVTGLPAGNHTIGVMVGSNSVTTFPYYQYVLEVEEVLVRANP